MKNHSVQVPPDHYETSEYLTRERWNSLWHQLTETLHPRPDSVLVVGIGDGLTSAILRARGIPTSTFDFDSDLRPDVVGDVRELLDYFPAKSFDVVLCCQVLEHIPYKDFEPALGALVSVARHRVILSLPYRHKRLLELSWQFLRLRELRASIAIPSFWRRWRFDGQHYWELGTRDYSVKRVAKAIRGVAPIQKRFFATGHRYHMFVVLDPTRLREAD